MGNLEYANIVHSWHANIVHSHGTASWGEGLDRGLSQSGIAYSGLGGGAQPYHRAQVGLKLNLDLFLRRGGDISPWRRLASFPGSPPARRR